jgi:hypothetical protein
VRKGLVGLAALALVGFLAGPAVAGDYHNGATLICADCHVMHYSQSHGYNPDGTGIWTSLGTTGPYEFLLRNEVNALCLSCHNGQAFAPDVLGANTGSAVRMAGALNQEGGVGLDATGHTLDSDATAPGSNPAWNNPDGLNCIDCHHQHGYGGGFNEYRNVRNTPGNTGFPGVELSYAVGTNDPTKDIYITAVREYDISNVFFNEPDPTGSAYADWCKGCHTEFHGATGGGEVGGATGVEWVRHPNAEANIGTHTGGHSSIGVYASKTNKTKVMSETGIWDSMDPLELAGSTPSCFSCHKAHGNNNAFGLIFLSGTGTVTIDGDDGTAAKDLCKQCHVQG